MLHGSNDSEIFLAYDNTPGPIYHENGFILKQCPDPLSHETGWGSIFAMKVLPSLDLKPLDYCHSIVENRPCRWTLESSIPTTHKSRQSLWHVEARLHTS